MGSITERAFVELRGVTKTYDRGVHALRGIDLALFAGEIAAVVGPSGSGKTTCANIVGCLDTPSSGRCWIGGQEATHLDAHGRALMRRHLMGFVFQSFNLLPHATALQNVALPLAYRQVARREAERRARTVLDAVGIGDRVHHLPSELSGGQQQRVAIARALVCEPRLMIADEPTGALDGKTGGSVMALLRELNQRHRITILLVTHDARIASSADRVIEFRDGSVVSDRHTRELDPC